MSSKPLCFRCKHFKQYQPLTFITPGECGWEPREAVPEWVQNWLNMDCRYYGPAKDVSTYWPIMNCAAFEEKTNEPEKV